MKHFVLFTFMIITAIAANSQITYRTTASGNFTATTTWTGGAAGTPPITGNCNCKIVISTGNVVTLDNNISINNVALVLDGPGSRIDFGNPNNRTLILGGTSSIDLQSTTASITGSKSGQTITLGGQVIYVGNSTTFNSTTAGVVNGLASAASVRASPQFQAGTLPVKLSEFSVAEKGSGVSITWKTQLEINSDHFEIERSGDGKEWSTIGKVGASGSISVEQSYAYTDAAPAQGTNYYRLRIVDIDSKYEYSPIKSVTVDVTTLALATNPNPASSTLNVVVNQPGKESFRLRLINRSGQVVYDQKHSAGNNRIQLNVSNFAEGSYFLEATNSEGLKKVNKVMIVRR